MDIDELSINKAAFMFGIRIPLKLLITLLYGAEKPSLCPSFCTNLLRFSEAL